MPTSQYQQLLTRFDAVGLDRYGITADDTDLNCFLESSVGVFLLEQDLEQVLTGDSLRWLPIETLETDDEEIIQALDSECHAPLPVTVLTGRRRPLWMMMWSE